MADVNALRDWRFSIDLQGIAWAVFDREGESQNSLGRRALEELMAIVERVEQGARDRSIRGLVIISGKEKGFIVGADVREFEALPTEAQVVEGITPVLRMLDKIERMLVPWFAASAASAWALGSRWRSPAAGVSPPVTMQRGSGSRK
jgi:3-hydroxyacyl-CoA dehydrogenase/enoyl-CoA hydratase/3-hydroxybutyryl-CoA epimerase